MPVNSLFARTRPEALKVLHRMAILPPSVKHRNLFYVFRAFDSLYDAGSSIVHHIAKIQIEGASCDAP